MSHKKCKSLEILENVGSRDLFKSLFVRLSAVLLLSLVVCATARAAGEVDPTFYAGAQKTRDEIGRALAVQPDGKILVGGIFTVVNGTVRNGLVRFNADGSLDASFNANLQETPVSGGGTTTVSVRNIKLQPDGRILVVGAFTAVSNSATRQDFVRLMPDGSLDLSFQAAISNPYYTPVFEIQPDGKIVMGVPSGNGNGVYSYAARLNTDGTVDTSFASAALSATPTDMALLPSGKTVFVGGFINAGAGAYIARVGENGGLEARADFSYGTPNSGVATAIAVQTDGKFVIGGSFSNVYGASQKYITRLNPDFSLDISFNVNGIGFNTGVNDVELTPEGKIIVGGNFTTYNGVTRKKVARLNSDGTLDASFNFNADNDRWVLDVLPVADGRVLVAGYYQNVSLAAYPLPKLVLRLNEDGTPDTSLNINIGRAGRVNAVLAQPDGKVLIGGEFELVNNVPRIHIARLNADGSLDTTFTPDNGTYYNNHRINALALQPDGKILVGRAVQNSDPNLSPNAIIRLNSDGSLDSSFDAGNCGTCVNAGVYAVKIQPDGRILVGGDFARYNGASTPNIARLNANGTIDQTFNPAPAPNREVYDVERQPDGKVLIAGAFTQFGSTIRGRIARLNADGSLDASFNPPFGANETVRDIALQTDGKVILGGDFTTVNASNRSRLARLNADGSLDAAFAPTSNSVVEAVTLQADGKILIGGSFTTVNGAARNRFARLNPDGSLDASFNVGSGADNSVYDVAVQADGKILLGGEFLRVNNAPAIGVARIFGNAKTAYDFDGDGKTDVSVFRPSNGTWYLSFSAGGYREQQFGDPGDKPVPADYDGDGKTDIAVFRPSTGFWYLLKSSGGFAQQQFALSGDVPVPADYDGDGKADLAVYRPSTGTWYLLQSTAGYREQQFGGSQYKSVAADYDGDGKADIAVYLPSNGVWYLLRSRDGYGEQQFGGSEFKPVPADYDGDGRADIAVFRPSNGVWHLLRSRDGYGEQQFAAPGDMPIPADYDGDGRADIAVYRPTNGIWYLFRSQQGFVSTQFGEGNDQPIPALLLP